MHDTAFAIGSKFLETYCDPERRIVLEIGAMNVNGTLRSVCPKTAIYLGVDIEHGDGVDVVADPQKPLPIRTGFSDLTISTSQMEHDPRFWKTFLELCRVTKKGGLIYFSAPSNGYYHSYPVDVWRFYPDSAKALASWAGENGYEITLVESFTAARRGDVWNDFVAVFFVGKLPETKVIKFLCDEFEGYNAWKFGCSEIQKYSATTEDQNLIKQLKDEVARLQAQIEVLTQAAPSAPPPGPTAEDAASPPAGNTAAQAPREAGPAEAVGDTGGSEQNPSARLAS